MYMVWLQSPHPVVRPATESRMRILLLDTRDDIVLAESE